MSVQKCRLLERIVFLNEFHWAHLQFWKDNHPQYPDALLLHPCVLLDVSSLLLLRVVFDTCARSAPAVQSLSLDLRHPPRSPVPACPLPPATPHPLPQLSQRNALIETMENAQVVIWTDLLDPKAATGDLEALRTLSRELRTAEHSMSSRIRMWKGLVEDIAHRHSGEFGVDEEVAPYGTSGGHDSSFEETLQNTIRYSPPGSPGAGPQPQTTADTSASSPLVFSESSAESPHEDRRGPQQETHAAPATPRLEVTPDTASRAAALQRSAHVQFSDQKDVVWQAGSPEMRSPERPQETGGATRAGADAVALQDLQEGTVDYKTGPGQRQRSYLEALEDAGLEPKPEVWAVGCGWRSVLGGPCQGGSPDQTPPFPPLGGCGARRRAFSARFVGHRMGLPNNLGQ